jgi:hypothetical protein
MLTKVSRVFGVYSDEDTAVKSFASSPSAG